MGSKRSNRTVADGSTKPDNFKLIRGISAAVENRLHQAGALTYEQLASLSPEEILKLTDNLPGLTTGRIIRQNWTGQARELSLGRPESDATQPDASRPDASQKEKTKEGERYSSFATEFLLDADSQVIHTRVMNVQTGDEEIWEGWDENRFVNFFVQGAGIPTAASVQTISPAYEPSLELEAPSPVSYAAEESAAPTAVEQPVEISEKLAEIPADLTHDRIESPVQAASPRSKMEVLTGDSNSPSKLLHHGLPFDVRLEFDLADYTSSGQEPLDYFAHIQARSLSDRRLHAIVHHLSGKIEPKEVAILDLKGFFLEPGSYRLAADVTIRSKDRNAASAPNLNFRVEGGVLQVY